MTCKGAWGTLAMPKTRSRNTVIYQLANGYLGEFGDAAWVGMRQTNPQSVYDEDKWAFVDNELISLSPKFGDMTAGGQIPLYTYNFTTKTERWHFFYHEDPMRLNRSEAADFCARTGSHLPYLQDYDEYNAIGKKLNVSVVISTYCV
uniref:C-type lectin domain-containing protein n=1 Tax=Ciona intestinalis TaxID=7719 RepID=H2XUR6_CIOIN